LGAKWFLIKVPLSYKSDLNLLSIIIIIKKIMILDLIKKLCSVFKYHFRKQICRLLKKLRFYRKQICRLLKKLRFYRKKICRLLKKRRLSRKKICRLLKKTCRLLKKNLRFGQREKKKERKKK
jgi:hypothetical protein